MAVDLEGYDPEAAQRDLHVILRPSASLHRPDRRLSRFGTLLEVMSLAEEECREVVSASGLFSEFPGTISAALTTDESTVFVMPRRVHSHERFSQGLTVTRKLLAIRGLEAAYFADQMGHDQAYLVSPDGQHMLGWGGARAYY